MAETLHICGTCKSRVYADFCDACGAMIERPEQGAQVTIETRRGTNRYDLRILLCVDCQTRPLDMQALADHRIASMEASTPSPS